MERDSAQGVMEYGLLGLIGWLERSSMMMRC